MVTFADLIMLLITFFVLLFSMSQVKTENWQAVVEALSDRLNPESASAKIRPSAERNARRVFEPKLLGLDYLDTVLAEKVAADPVLEQSVIERLEDRLVISLPGRALFAPGSARLAPDARAAIAALGALLQYVDNRIDVNGHTLAAAEPTEIFESNWELSLARALAVAEALREAGLGQRITAFGLADSRFHDISRALPDWRRLELARRVDVVLREGVAKRGRNDP
jgi:chemotaxis protein MotB